MSGFVPRARTRTYLEMTSPDQLIPSEQTAEISLEERPAGDDEVRQTIAAIAAPYGWRTAYYDAEEWAAYFAADRRHWLIKDADQTIGSLELQISGSEVQVETFGLVPESVGTGRGGAALTAALRHAWTIAPGITRVWLHTSNLDNPAALPNYQARGLVPYKTEYKTD